MARRAVVESTCDRCTTEHIEPLPRRVRGEKTLTLPDGWLHVSGATSRTVAFELDLCGECKLAVLAAAGVARFGI